MTRVIAFVGPTIPRRRREPDFRRPLGPGAPVVAHVGARTPNASVLVEAAATSGAVRVCARESEQPRQSARLSVPVLLDNAAIRRAQDVTQDKRSNDRVIERARDWDELGNEVNGRCEPDRSDREGDLRASRHTRVGHQTAEELKEMWQKHRDLASQAATSADDEAEHQGGVEDRKHEQPGDDVVETHADEAKKRCQLAGWTSRTGSGVVSLRSLLNKMGN